jgi:hypothetical protein
VVRTSGIFLKLKIKSETPPDPSICECLGYFAHSSHVPVGLEISSRGSDGKRERMTYTCTLVRKIHLLNLMGQIHRASSSEEQN